MASDISLASDISPASDMAADTVNLNGINLVGPAATPMISKGLNVTHLTIAMVVQCKFVLKGKRH
jgi:hypothetical protein